MTYIKSIKGILPYTTMPIDIELDGKNLILTGLNGSGKTRLLRMISDPFSVINQDFQKISSVFEFCVDQKIFLENIKTGKFIFNFFQDNRNLIKAAPSTKLGIDLINQENIYKLNLCNSIEDYLIKLKIFQEFQFRPNNHIYDKVDVWFTNFIGNLKDLLDDETTELIFDPGKMEVSVIQDGREEYKFEHFSSGYKSIFNIYFELALKEEVLNGNRFEIDEINQKKIEGVAVIDEIDVHLNPALKDKVIPFLINAFPKIQFIFSTHSQRIVKSTRNFKIYDVTLKRMLTREEWLHLNLEGLY